MLDVAIRLPQEPANPIAPYGVTDMSRSAQTESAERELITYAIQNDRALRCADARLKHCGPREARAHMARFWKSETLGHTCILTQFRRMSVR